MSLTPEQIVKLQNKLPGWREAWGELCVALLGWDGESGALVKAVNSLPIKWPKALVKNDDGERERREGTARQDFIAKVIANYHRRAERGTLLSTFTPAHGDVVSFLTSRKVLKSEAWKFLSKLKTRQMISLDAEYEPASPQPPDREFESLICDVQQQLEQIMPSLADRMNRIAEQAALQLFPRLDWSEPAMAPLREHLIRVVHSPNAEQDPLALLSERHRLADQVFRNHLDRLASERHNKGKGVSVKKRESLEKLYGQLLFKRVFLPLDTAALVELLRIKRADAAQRRHRYRNALKRLLPQLGAYYDALL